MFSVSQLLHLNIDPVCNSCVCNLATRSVDDTLSLSFGKFKDVLKVLFDSRDGSLCNDYMDYITENAPDDVKLFVQNFLMRPLQALPSAPDDDTAFDTIIPRLMSSPAEFQPYVDYLNQSLENFNSNSNSTPISSDNG